MARLHFGYGDAIINADAKGQTVEHFADDHLIVMPRDHRAEQLAAGELEKCGWHTLQQSPLLEMNNNAATWFLPRDDDLDDEDDDFSPVQQAFENPHGLLTFSAETVPDLVRRGWHVTFSQDYPYQIAEGEPTWWADIGDGSGIDWFSFELGIEFEGERLSLVPHLTELLAQLPAGLTQLALSASPDDTALFGEVCSGIKFYHQLHDGRMLPLTGERLAPMLKALLELIGPHGKADDDGRVRLSRTEAAALSRFADDSGEEVAWRASADRLLALGRKLRRGHQLKAVKPPKSFKASLRPYQCDGLAWLDFLRDARFGGVLADDMGLGKTVQALAFLAREKASRRLDRPALIVAPTSVLPNWLAEAKRFAPNLKVLPLRGPDRKARFDDMSSHDLVLTTYPLLARDHAVLLVIPNWIWLG